MLQARSWRAKLIALISLVLVVQALTGLPKSEAALVDCTSSQFTVEAKSNPVFYFDNGTSITSNYLQYLITNKNATLLSGYYVKIEGITSNRLSIATYEDAAHPLPASFASNDSTNAYWYLTASGTDNNSSSVDVAFYNGNPASGGTGVCKITKTITKVDSTIAANANKVTSVVYSALPTANADGSATFTATVKGQTGTIGAGPTGAKDVNLSPATASNFDAKRFRLSGTSYRCGTGTATLNVLYVQNACSGLYTAVFTFQYLNATASNASASQTLSPIMQIASGSQMKHTSTPSFTIAAIGSAQANQLTTTPANNVAQNGTSASATLTGTKDYEDPTTPFTSVFFCYKASASVITTLGANPCPAGSTSVSATVDGNGNYYANTTGLTINSTYYFELVGVYGSSSVALGGVQSFIAKPYDTTTDASSILDTSATLNGTQTGLTVDNVDILNSYFIYSTTNPASGHLSSTTDSITALSAVDPTTNLVFRKNLTGLSSSTTYYYEILIADGNGVTYLGGVKSFQTLSSGTPAPNYTVTFNGNNNNGGTSPSVASVTQASSGASVSLATVGTLARDGYTFGGWNESANGDYSNYNAGSSFTPTSNITLYAKWNPNQYVYDGNTGTGTGPSNQLYAGSQLTASSNSFTPPNGYLFDGWCSTTVTVGGTCGGTIYAAGANLPTPMTSTVTLYAIWKTAPAGGGSAPAPVYVPHPPTITSISAPEVCAVSSQLTIKGTFLTNASVKVDGLSATVLASSHNELTIQLPSAPVGTKTITVTNVDGSATTTVKYAFADTPIYVDYIYPETYKDRAFTYTFKALDAVKYEIAGVMPAGLTLNPLTGELSGTPTQEGDYVFQIIASNICANTPLIVYMFVDKAIPSAFTCSVAFNVPSSNNVSDIKIAQLKNCLDKMNTLSPKYIQPVVFLSGGVPAGLTPDQALTHPRYLPIIAAIQSVNANAQIYLGAFSGTLDSVQVNVYWPDPS